MLIPRFISAYTYHRNNTSEITDAPTIRSINFILQDEFDDWRDGEMMLQSLITTPEDVQRAASHQATLEDDHGRGRRHHRARQHRRLTLTVLNPSTSTAYQSAATITLTV